MASLLRIKRSAVSGNPAVLAQGELAYSALTDNGSNGGDRLYIGTGTETNGNAVNHVVIGGKRYTDMVDAATNSNTVSTIVKRDGSGDFAANIITATLNGNSSTTTKWLNARDLSLTGDATATLTAVDGSANVSATLTLANSGVTAGSYGGSTAVPVITVDAKGRVTAVSTSSISTTLTIAGGTGTDTVALGTDTLTFAGGTGVTTTVTNNQVSFAIGQAVGTTDNVTFNSVTVNGTLTSDDITSANISVTGNATITGNLTVQGTTTTIDSTTVNVADLNITVAKGAANATAANGAGLTVDGAGATLTYNSTTDRWVVNKDFETTGTIYGTVNAAASSAAKWTTARDLSLTGDATATLTAVDGTANVSAALTLATVNSNVGSFGSGTAVPAITVNGKGLITAVTTNNIPTATTSVLGLASFDSNDFTVTSGSVSINSVNGGTY